MLSGAVGQLEAIIDKPSESVSEKYVAVCCHPHPQHGGTMGNKVIYTASRSLAGLGITSIRFNFRGVGKSEGEYDDGVGEQDDLKAVVGWIRQEFPDFQIIFGGFSFGAYISSLQAINLGCRLLISIAPPIGRIEFVGFDRPNCPWLVIQGDEDELVDANKVEEWLNGFQEPAELHRMPAASHFFHGKLVELRSIVESSVRRILDLASY